MVVVGWNSSSISRPWPPTCPSGDWDVQMVADRRVDFVRIAPLSVVDCCSQVTVPDWQRWVVSGGGCVRDEDAHLESSVDQPVPERRVEGLKRR